MSYSNNRGRQKDNIIANHRIKHPEVRLIDEKGEQLGIVSIREAQLQARDAGKDLILIAEQAQPPVVKLIALDKYKYQLQQKEAADRKQARKQDLKEVRFSPFMGENDFQSRLNKVEDFLENGDKVRLSLMFKGRAITKKEFGYEMFGKIFETTQEYAKVEIEPKIIGKKLIAQLTPTGKKKVTKSQG